jgi:hypothetical protein
LKSEKKAGGKLGASSNYDDDYGAIQAFDGLGYQNDKKCRYDKIDAQNGNLQ